MRTHIVRYFIEVGLLSVQTHTLRKILSTAFSIIWPFFLLGLRAGFGTTVLKVLVGVSDGTLEGVSDGTTVIFPFVFPLARPEGGANVGAAAGALTFGFIAGAAALTSDGILDVGLWDGATVLKVFVFSFFSLMITRATLGVLEGASDWTSEGSLDGAGESDGATVGFPLSPTKTGAAVGVLQGTSDGTLEGESDGTIVLRGIFPFLPILGVVEGT